MQEINMALRQSPGERLIRQALLETVYLQQLLTRNDFIQETNEK